MKKFVVLLPLSFVFTSVVADDVIDPADVTNVYTQSAVMVSGDSSLQWQGQIAGGLESGQQFALLGEATFDSKDNGTNKFGLDYQFSRVQYFHVFDTGLQTANKAGVSLDYINTRTSSIKNDLFAVGAVAAINPAYLGGLLVFPVASLITGNIELADNTRDDLTGIGASLITAKYLGDSGAYISVTPELQDLSGHTVDLTNLTIKTSINAPLNSSRTWWINTRYDITKSRLSGSSQNNESAWQTQAWIGARHYF